MENLILFCLFYLTELEEAWGLDHEVDDDDDD
jgi:hypothetical protein